MGSDDTDSALDRIRAATSAYRRTKLEHERSIEEVVSAVVAAIRDNPNHPRGYITRVVKASPFTATHVRAIAREHGIQAPGPSRHPSRRGSVTMSAEEFRESFPGHAGK